MSYVTPRLEWEFDWVAGALIALMLAFQAVALHLVQWTQQTLTLPSQQTSVSLSGWVIGIAAIEIAVLLVLWRLYKRLPDRWQRYVKYAIYGLLILSMASLAVISYWGHWYLLLRNVALAVMVYILVSISGEYKWMAFNLIAFIIGVIVVTMLSTQVAPRIVIVVMLAFTVYDHIAVNLSAIMSDFIEFSSSAEIPNFFVIPNQIQVDLDSLFAFLRDELDEKPDEIAGVIGLGDYIFPTLLVASASVKYGLHAPVVAFAALGTILTFPILRAATLRSENGVPALPWLNTGAISGYAVGLVVIMSGV